MASVVFNTTTECVIESYKISIVLRIKIDYSPYAKIVPLYPLKALFNIGIPRLVHMLS